jgi:hypothetical protein
VGLVALGCGAKTGLWVDDVVEDRSDAGTPPADLCVELPPETPPETIDVSFVAQLQSAEVTLLVDVTGSMNSEIERIRSTLRDEIVPGMVAAIPEVRLSVAFFSDFPVDPYGDTADVAFGLLLESTSDRAAAQAAVEMLPSMYGMDEAEAQVEALYQIATGSGCLPYIPPASCPPGTVGYPCYATSGGRIILLFTDAPFHNGSGLHEPYDPTRFVSPPATYTDAVLALNAIGAKVLGLWSGSTEPDELNGLARATGAVTADGIAIVRRIGESGEYLDASVVNAVRSLVEEVPLDVDVLFEDLPGDDGDALMFVARVEALRADPPSGAVLEADRFVDVLPGTQVTFRIYLDNDVVPAAEDDQLFRLLVVLRGDGITRLQETPVDIVVPGFDGDGCPDS